MRNTSERYGAMAQGLHWLMALMIIGLFGVGLWMGGLPNGEFKGQVYGLHKAMGVLVLLLVVFRLIWRQVNVQPRPQYEAAWEHTLATAMHWALYALMLAVPVIGWLMSDTGGRPVSFFGLYTFPLFIGKNEPLHEALEGAHAVSAFLMMALAALHAAAAVWHHRVRKDSVLARMLPFRA